MAIFQKLRGETRDTAAADASPARLLEEIEALGKKGRLGRSKDAGPVLDLRHRAGLALREEPTSKEVEFADPDFGAVPHGALPEVAAHEVTPELLRGAILRNGCLLVRGLVPADEARRVASEIDQAFEARRAQLGGRRWDKGYYREFEADARFNLETERLLARAGSGLWMADSPKVLLDVFDLFERAGLRTLATDYLGERSAISINKSLLRKVPPSVFEDGAGPGAKPSAWHQDGAFLGDVRALNVWLSLSRCGDEAPGLDVVPRRIDHVVPTGTEGASFDWSVSHEVAREEAGETGVVRPVFDPGDALLFDELFLHSTAAEPDMPSTRYAVESWFFGVSGFPPDYAPLVF